MGGLPISSDRNQAGCDPISSNCVIWQGPDIECIDLCKGDSISDVTAKLAEQLCDILEQLDITGFDLTCFNPICPSLENFHELIQFLIDRICICCPITPVVPEPDTTCPDTCIVDIAPCFYYLDGLGNTITQMTLKDYAIAIGNKICDLTGQIDNINSSINNLQSQVAVLNTRITDTDSRIPAAVPNITSSCLISAPPAGIPIDQFVAILEAAFCELRAATGLPIALLNSILKQCVSLDTSQSLNLPGVNMGSLPGWITSGSYSTVASSINNMWITICDMRAAVRSILDTCCPQGCEGLVISLQTTLTGANLNFFWTGDGTGFEDCNPAGSLVTITDAYGATFTTRIPIVAYINLPYSLNISGTPLNTATNLSIHIDACFRKISDGTTCERCIESSITNQSACPVMTLGADDTSIVYSFTNGIAGAVQYDIALIKFSDSSLVDQHTIVLGGIGPVTGTFTGLLPGTMYSITTTITISGTPTNVCPSGVITTQPLSCNPPTAVSASTILS